MSTAGAGGLSVDFQSQQIEKIVDAIALTLPSGGLGNHSIIGGIVGTVSTEQNSVNGVKYEDYCIRELAFDLGVDPRALKSKIQQAFASGLNNPDSQSDKLSNLQFHL